MSFAMKTRSQAASFRQKRDTSLQMYSAQLEAYAKTHMASFDGNETAVTWTTRHAKRFSTTVNEYVPLSVIARDLTNYLTAYASTKKVVSKVSAGTDLIVTSYLVGEFKSHSEWNKGRDEFNRFLFAEFDTWYSAFEAEANEDFEADAPSVDSRWVYHCAKKLNKRLGLKVDVLAAMVEAWLSEHTA